MFLARDVIHTSRAYVMMPVRPSVCDGSALAHSDPTLPRIGRRAADGRRAVCRRII